MDDRIESKVDEIIAGNKEVKHQLNRRTFWFLIATAAFTVILLIFAILVFRINSIANRNRDTNKNTNQIVHTLDDATGPEAQVKSQQVLAGAIAELRRSFDCVNIYIQLKESPPACADVITRVEALRNS